MFIEMVSRLFGSKLSAWKELMKTSGLTEDAPVDSTVLLWDGDILVATGSRTKNIIKYLAVSKDRQGEDLLSTVITELRKDAFESGYRHLFLYTKPSNKYIFSSLFFYPIAETDDVLFMENKQGGIDEFIKKLPQGNKDETTGALVMNCNPFTLGHRYVIEKAAMECDRVFVFVLSEDGDGFAPRDRLEMVRLGVADLTNVTVLETGPYLISSATFPTYFLKNRDSADTVVCDVDIEIFTKYFAPRLCINRRYVGTEPTSPMTEKYNIALGNKLPRAGIEFRVIERKTEDGVAISASLVRKLLKEGNYEPIKKLVPQTTFDYIMNNKLI